MRNTKQYGLVSSWQEHQMLIHAEHTYERKHKQKKSRQVKTCRLLKYTKINKKASTNHAKVLI